MILGNFNNAIKCFDKSLDLDPSSTAALNLKGLALDSLGKYNEAIDCYNLAIDLDPTLESVKDNKIRAQNALENEEIGLLEDIDKEDLDYNNKDYNECLNCGFKNLDSAFFCSECGKTLKEKEIHASEEIQIVDVNQDSVDKIAGLPNINCILAKKAVQIRKNKGGFESIEDFCFSMELKPHVAKKN